MLKLFLLISIFFSTYLSSTYKYENFEFKKKKTHKIKKKKKRIIKLRPVKKQLSYKEKRRKPILDYVDDNRYQSIPYFKLDTYLDYIIKNEVIYNFFSLLKRNTLNKIDSFEGTVNYFKQVSF